MVKKIFLIFGLALLFGFVAPDFASVAMPFDQQQGLIAPPTDPNHSGLSDPGVVVISGIILKVVGYARNILGVVCVLLLTWTGLLMATSSGSEDTISQSKKGLTWSMIALTMLFAVEPMITDVLYGGGKINPGDVLVGGTQASIAEGTKQIMAAIEWVKAIVAIGAVLYVIVAGMKMIMAFGDEEQIGAEKKIIQWIAVGFVIITLNNIIVDEVVYKRVLGADGRVVFSQDPVRGITELVGVIKFFLKFLAVVAIVGIVYGGGSMITSFGDSDRADKGKKIIMASGIGFVIILSSYALTSSLISASS